MLCKPEPDFLRKSEDFEYLLKRVFVFADYQQPRMSQPSPYNQMMAPPSMNVFPHLTEVARAIRSAVSTSSQRPIGLVCLQVLPGILL